MDVIIPGERPGPVAGRSQGDPGDRLALRDLVECYAGAVDARDVDLFVSLFTADAVIEVHRADRPGRSGQPGPAAVFAGTEALATLPGAATLADLVRALDARYPQTFHLVGNHRARVAGDTATAETYCLAHHLHAAADGTPTDLRMLVHYADACRRGPDGVWRLHRRVVTAKWQSPHPVDASVLDAAGRPPEAV